MWGLGVGALGAGTSEHSIVAQGSASRVSSKLTNIDAAGVASGADRVAMARQATMDGWLPVG
jgi:microcompartment protein CcmK/EutM